MLVVGITYAILNFKFGGKRKDMTRADAAKLGIAMGGLPPEFFLRKY